MNTNTEINKILKIIEINKSSKKKGYVDPIERSYKKINQGSGFMKALRQKQV